MSASLTLQVRLGFSMGWRIWTPNEVRFYTKTLAHSYFIYIILKSKFLKKKIWIVNYTILMGVEKYFVFIEFIDFGFKTKEERTFWKKIIYISLLLRHIKFLNNLKIKKVRNKRKLKKIGTIISRAFSGRFRGILAKKAWGNVKKKTLLARKKKLSKFFKTSMLLVNFGESELFASKSKLGLLKLLPKDSGLIRLNRSSLWVFTLWNVLKKNKLKTLKGCFRKRKNKFLKKIGKKHHKKFSKKGLLWKSNVMGVRKKIKRNRKKLSYIAGDGWVRFLKNFKVKSYKKNSKKKGVMGVNLAKSNFSLSQKKFHTIETYNYLRAKQIVIKKNSIWVKKISSKSKNNLLFRVRYDLLNEVIEAKKIKMPPRISIVGGPRKRLSRNLKRAFRGQSIKKLIELVWFWEKVARMVTFYANWVKNGYHKF